MVNKKTSNECCAISVKLCLIDLLLPETIKYNNSGTCDIAANMLHRFMVQSGILVML